MLLSLLAAAVLPALPPVMESPAAQRNPSHWSDNRGRWVTTGYDSYPSPSPDGKWIAFHSTRTGRQALWIAPADASTPPRLFLQEEHELAAPTYSPDGKRFVYVATIDGESEIFTINVDGTDKRRLTNWRGSDSHPHWSGDGKRIFFNSDRDTADLSVPWAQRTHDLYSMDLNGGDVRRHTNCQSICTFPSPSPDGRWLAYRRFDNIPGKRWTQEDSRRDSEVYIAEIDGSNPRNLTDNRGYDGYPMWSPDSKWIAYASTRGGEVNVAQIYMVRPDGSGLRQVTQGWWSHAAPVFSADGTQIYTAKNFDMIDVSIGFIAVVDVPKD